MVGLLIDWLVGWLFRWLMGPERDERERTHVRETAERGAGESVCLSCVTEGVGTC